MLNKPDRAMRSKEGFLGACTVVRVIDCHPAHGLAVVPLNVAEIDQRLLARFMGRSISLIDSVA